MPASPAPTILKDDLLEQTIQMQLCGQTILAVLHWKANFEDEPLMNEAFDAFDTHFRDVDELYKRMQDAGSANLIFVSHGLQMVHPTRYARVSYPLADVGTRTDLDKKVRAAKTTKANADAWVEWCNDNPEGGILPDGRDVDADGVKAIKAQARGHLRTADAILAAAPDKQQWLQKYHETRDALRQTNPELFEEDSPELAEAVQLVRFMAQEAQVD